LLEAATEPIENRIAYIRNHKPADEVETRLRLLRPVAGDLPPELVEARAALDKAGATHNKARAAYNKAWDAYNKARAAYDKARAAYNKARAAYNKARAAYNKARAAYNKAWDALNKALADHTGEIEALHRVECPDCPWDGQTIFPDKKEI